MSPRVFAVPIGMMDDQRHILARLDVVRETNEVKCLGALLISFIE